MSGLVGGLFEETLKNHRVFLYFQSFPFIFKMTISLPFEKIGNADSLTNASEKEGTCQASRAICQAISIPLGAIFAKKSNPIRSEYDH